MREEVLKREAELKAENERIESNLRARVMMPQVSAPQPEPQVEMFRVGPPDPPSPKSGWVCKGIVPDNDPINGQRFTPTMVGSITARSLKLKEAAITGHWPTFQALGGTFEEFKNMRDKLPRLKGF